MKQFAVCEYCCLVIANLRAFTEMSNPFDEATIDHMRSVEPKPYLVSRAINHNALIRSLARSTWFQCLNVQVTRGHLRQAPKVSSQVSIET